MPKDHDFYQSIPAFRRKFVFNRKLPTSGIKAVGCFVYCTATIQKRSALFAVAGTKLELKQHMQAPILQTISPKLLVGMSLQMNLAENQTYTLWRNFMPRKKEICKVTGTELISMEIYHDDSYFDQFDLNTHFEKWAVVEVAAIESIPAGMQAFELSGGLYAQFTHHGPAADFAKTFGHIFTVWLPDSGYRIDNSRPHFEVMGAKYNHNELDSEEEVWVPIKL